MFWKALLQVIFVSVAVSYTFEDYVQEFDKHYPVEEEYSARQAIFLANYTRIQQHNQQNLSYTLRVNNFTDWTQSEITNMLLGSELARATVAAGSPKVRAAQPLAVAGEVNWDLRGKVTPAKSQGRCGSCWAFAAAAVYESFLAIQSSNLYDLSEEYLLECTPGSSCDGGSIQAAFVSITNIDLQGLPQQSKFGYKANKINTGTPQTDGICVTRDKKHINRRITYKSYLTSTANQIKGLLASSPLAVGMYASSDFIHFGGGVFSCSNDTTSADLNHAVQLIGYDNRGWLLKNSWGKGWGNDGKIVLSYDGDCGILLLAYQFEDTGVTVFQLLTQLCLWLVLVNVMMN